MRCDLYGSESTKCFSFNLLTILTNPALVWWQARSNNVSRGSSLLFPHMQPTMGARSHVTFCCVLNPQPTYMEVEAAKKTDKAISMYSQWAVSEPILLPTDLSIVDLLNGWK